MMITFDNISQYLNASRLSLDLKSENEGSFGSFLLGIYSMDTHILR